MAGEVIKALHTGISVRDMDEALAWYENVLGFKPVYDQGYVPPLGAHLYFIEDRNGYQIELFKYDDPKPCPEDRWNPNSDLQTMGTKHVAFIVDDMASLREHFVSNNVDIAHEVNMGDEAVMFIRDPDGVLIEFIKR